MITCRQATDLLTEEREGTLPGGSTRAWFWCHMIICKHCRTYKRQLGVVIDAAKEAPREAVPAEIEDALVAAFRAKKPR